MSKIKKIQAREILDSRGNPTVEVEVFLDDGTQARASVPSGASTGKHEALELRDNDPKRFGGKGVLKACFNVNDIIGPKLVGVDPRKQEEIDKLMINLDGTENKSKLGANAILGVSLAVCKAAAKSESLELFKYIGTQINTNKNTEKHKISIPMFNIINGGKHADSGLSIQEFMIVPQGISSFREKVRAGSEIFHTLKDILENRGLGVSVGDEGGFAPHLGSDEEALGLIVEATQKAGYKAGAEISIALDAAANSFHQNGEYVFQLENRSLSRDELIDLYLNWAKRYPIMSLEDGLEEDDWSGWQELSSKFPEGKPSASYGASKVQSMPRTIPKGFVRGSKSLIVGDDLLVTSVKRLKRAIKEKSANSILIKPNQVGTLTETLECIKVAKENGFKTIISHRSGETPDTFISDLAVGTGSEYIKSGSLSRGERVCKYNRLMEIELSPKFKVQN